MSLLLLWNGPNFTPPVVQNQPERFKIATPISEDDLRTLFGIPPLPAGERPVVEETETPARRRVGKPTRSPTPPWEAPPWPTAAPQRELDPQIPAEIEALVTMPVLPLDDDEDAIWLLLEGL